MDTNGYKVKFTSHPTYRLLNNEPNQKMTRFTFIKTLVVSTLLKGNGFAYIERDNEGNATALHYIPSELVTIITPKTLGDNVAYSVTGISNVIESCNMIHILNFSYDGITGISTLSHAKNTLGLAADSEAHASGFFKGGANISINLDDSIDNPSTDDGIYSVSGIKVKQVQHNGLYIRKRKKIVVK